MASAASLIKEIQDILVFSSCFLVISGYIGQVNGYITEYCSKDTFAPQCGSNEVIVMKHAVYGRMRKGKCLSSSSGLGCETDALRILDVMCSNKARCQVVVHQDLDSVENSCPPDMFRYLEADHACEQVLQIEYAQCRSAATKIEVSTKLSVSSDVLSEANCGSSSIHFTARPGQQLNISIIDFNYNGHENNHRSCINYLELTEPNKQTPHPVCAGSYERTGHVMLSSGQDITAVFHIQDPRNQQFILSFEAVGCGDITPQEGTWVQRDGDETTLGCHSSRHSWTLRCDHNQWIGAVGSCGTAVDVQHETVRTHAKKQTWNIATGMVVFAIFSVLLFMCSTTFSIGVCVYTKGNENLAYQPTTRYHQQTLPLIANSRHQPAANIPNNQMFIEQQQFMQQHAGQSETPIENATGQKPLQNESGADSDQMYCNTNTIQSQSDSMYSDSVKYYVLENIRDPNSTPMST